MLGNNYINFLNLIINEEGKLDLDFEDDILKSTCITRDGEVVNERVQELIMLNES